MWHDSATRQFIATVRAITGGVPLNLALYRIALQHSSLKEGHTSNERLEFLGDALLSSIVATYLFKKFPLKGEGFLTDIRSRLVNRDALNTLARKMHLDKLLQYDEILVHKGNSKYIYGNALEALIGAVYLDHGYAYCEQFVLERLIGNYISLEDLIARDTNFKSQIVEWAHKQRFTVRFKTTLEAAHLFTAQVLIDEKVFGEGKGRTKKCAEQSAAQQALQQVQSFTEENAPQ
ncbi:ribonuclease III [Candidatus Cardinium hertigii]|uniref:Ribonuclease 3 n=1 Tax=Candidatus Cardinium hertigii TaxID=247481 RepID=A0A2Z3LIJ7_9BACT|nr:ribonuclease III [Candidatus Cardinium hertigii]AWN81880.1 Ribonuclease 3 [Candidatus Cardinium hertigii]